MKHNNSPVDLILEEVNRRREEDGENPRTILLLEGYTDKHVYRWQVDERKCHMVVTNGRDHLLKAQATLEEKGVDGVMSISDADFQLLCDFLRDETGETL